MKVRFLPQDITCDIKPNQSVLDVAQDNNIFVKSVCGGVPSCAECRVRVIDGEYNVLPPSHNELSLIGTAHFVDRRRLSCQLRCFGDITIDLSEQVAKQQAQTSGKVKNRAGQREESIESHAVKGSILAESRSMLSPPSASSGAPSPRDSQAPGADRGPKGPRPGTRENRSPQQTVAKTMAPPGEKSEGGARRRRGGRGRNKSRGSGGGTGTGGTSGASGGSTNTGGGGPVGGS